MTAIAFLLAEWATEAACRGESVDLFFPLGTPGPGPARSARKAMAICAGCPVRSECLSYALRTGQQYGIWGGVAEEERRRLMRSTRRRRTSAQ